MPDNRYLALGNGLIDGVPNCLYGDVPASELEASLSTPNLVAAERKPDLINKAIKKEEKNHLSIVTSGTVARYTRDIGIIKLGIVEKPHCKDRMIRHCSRITEEVTNPVNVCCDAKSTEPPVTIGKVFKNHINKLWDTKRKYPDRPLDQYDDDISGAFPQQAHHPGIAKAQCSMHQRQMIISFALHFGGNYGPAAWTPIGDA